MSEEGKGRFWPGASFPFAPEMLHTAPTPAPWSGLQSIRPQPFPQRRGVPSRGSEGLPITHVTSVSGRQAGDSWLGNWK